MTDARPPAVTLAGYAMLVVGLGEVSMAPLVPALLAAVSSNRSAALATAGVLLLGAADVVLGIGLLKGMRSARRLTLAWQPLVMAVQLPLGGVGLGLLVSGALYVVLLLCLLEEDAKAYFGGERR